MNEPIFGSTVHGDPLGEGEKTGIAKLDKDRVTPSLPLSLNWLEPINCLDVGSCGCPGGSLPDGKPAVIRLSFLPLQKELPLYHLPHWEQHEQHSDVSPINSPS